MKYKFLFLTVSLLSSCILSFSQVTDIEKSLREQNADTALGWKRGGVFALNLAQTSLTNWAAGGQNSFATNGLISLFENFRSRQSSWVNTLDIGYGVIKQGSTGLQKTDDKLDFLSKYGRKAFDHLYYAVLFNFKTQFSAGYKYVEANVKEKISDIFAPAYFIGAVGMDFKPGPYFSAFIAPLTGRLTIVNDIDLSQQGAFGVTAGKKSLSEFGAYLRIVYSRTDFKSELLRNVAFTTKLDLFSNYLKKPQNIVVNWDNLLAMKINKFISANVNTQLIYDDKVKIPYDRNRNGVIEPGETVASRVQFKEILGAGLSYKF